jgi:predicted TPR repeat methyltransferase
MSDESLVVMSDQAWSLVESGRLEEARPLFMKICEIDASDPEPWMMLGSLHAEFSDMPAAISCLEKSIELDPSYPDAHLNLAKVLVKQDRREEACRHCQIAIDHDPSYADAWQLLGVTQESMGDFAAAEFSSRKATELAPDNAFYHANLALALWKQDKLEASVEAYQKSLQLDPKLVDAWMQLAAVYCYLRVDIEAERCYKEAIGIAPDNGAAHARLGDLLSRQKRKDEAIDSFRKAALIKPDDAGIHLQLAWALQSKRQWDAAMSSFQVAVSLAPENVEAHFGLGAVCLEKGMDAQAIEHFQHALVLDPDNEQIQFHLAQLTGVSLSAPPADYVRNLFDDYAERFDSHLVGELAYRGPELVHAAVKEVLGLSGKRMDILDLGCGTGLCAPMFREQALKLSGIDLSGKMVDVARRRNLYDNLLVGDIAVELEGMSEEYDLIIAADVFIYVGDLERIFKLCARTLRKSGLLAFTIEAAKNESASYVLETSGRYSHTTQYVRALAESSGLEISMMRSGILRMDHGSPIHGYVVALRLP